MRRLVFLLAGVAVVLALTAPLGSAPARAPAASVVLRPPDLWSFNIESRRLLADLGYSVEYTFEFYDEEEIRVVALSERTILVEGTLRTILDGDPAYAQFRLRGEDFPFWVVLNPDGLTATRMTPDGLRPAGVPEAEIQQWIARLRSLLHDTRERLGLWDFQPSIARMVRLALSPIDVLSLVPADDPIQRYEVSQPGTSRAVEVLVVEVREQTWSIRWAPPTLTVTIGTGRRQATRSFQGPSRDTTATTAVTLLRNARQQLGTARIVLPLPWARMEWWRKLFNTSLYFDLYEPQDTELAKTQVPQLTALLGLTPPARVLDVGCGYGRHSVELARLGFQVTGVDISEVQLARARERAQAAEVAVDFRLGDARALEFEAEFDAAISMFLSFGLFETDAEHHATLEGISRALRPGGRFLMDFWNREYEIQRFDRWQVERTGDVFEMEEWEFDHLNGRLNWTNHAFLPDGRHESWFHSIRAHTVVEVRMLFERAGLRLDRVYGTLAAAPYSIESPAAIFVATKL